MKAVFVHLSGSNRGTTQSFEKESILLGSDPSCDVHFEAAADEPVSARHAEIYFENCEYYLRDAGLAGGTFVNHHEVQEIILKDSDVLEFGEGGPKVRFHIERATGEMCKPFRVVYRDSMKKSSRFQERGLRCMLGFCREFGRSLLLESTPAVRTAFMSLVALLVVSTALSGVVIVQNVLSKRRLERDMVLLKTQLTSDRIARGDLERAIAEERGRMVEFRQQHETETSAKISALQEEERRLREQLQHAQGDASTKAGELAGLRNRLDQTGRQMVALQRDRSLGERIIKQYQGGVCFIEGGYQYHDAAGRPLRFAGLDSKGVPLQDPAGRVLYTVFGGGPIVKIDYSGTGFLVSPTGFILTNRHVAEPWWQAGEFEELTHEGFTPRFAYFRAYFPGVSEPFTLDVVKISQEADVALLRTTLGKHHIPVLEIERQSSALQPGQPVVLLGYPTGLNALLARLDDGIVASIVNGTGPNAEKISQELSNRGMIRPLATQGHLSDILPNKLVYDAQTTYGGSGGPLFSDRGKVIGVNFAILSEFSGANFGVPIELGLKLMR